MVNIALIGSTGSIGKQVLNVVRRHRDKFNICALVTGGESELFRAQAEEFKPQLAAAYNSDPSAALAACETDEADLVFNAAGGFAGLEYSVRALTAGKRLALANKETLVCGGGAVMELARYCGGEVIPVDSEHSAIWQCLGFDLNAKFRRLIITASGGAFRGFSPEQLKTVTPELALNHPTWRMGKKITVDSATLMNKGYEVIEAHVLYGAPYDKIETVIQPTSVVHSLVEFDDGACLAQMGYPSMEVPIQLALTYPDRLNCSAPALDFKHGFSVDFEELVPEKYPLYKLATDCGRAGGIMPCVLNAADEEAVWAFLRGKIPFTAIYDAVYGTLAAAKCENCDDLEGLKEVDRSAREAARKIINKLK